MTDDRHDQDPDTELTTAGPAPDATAPDVSPRLPYSTPTTALPAPPKETEPTTALPIADITATTWLPGAPVQPTAAGPGAATAGSFLAGGRLAGATTAVLPHPRIAPYVQAALEQLGDLPVGERAELLDDLDAHLHEILAEESEAFESRLYAPRDYAAEFTPQRGTRRRRDPLRDAAPH